MLFKFIFELFWFYPSVGRDTRQNNGGCQSDLPDLEFKAWLQYRKMQRSNKLVRDDLRKDCQELEAGISKGKAWLKDRAWVFQFKKFQTMSNAIFKLQVRKT